MAIGFTPHAYETTGNAQTWRTPTETLHPECEKDRRRRERERRSREEYNCGSVQPCKIDSAISSTCSVNLALAMAKDSRKKVGILDLDIFGPSIPTLMALNHGGEPELTKSKLSSTACSTKLKNTSRRVGPSDEPWNSLHVYGFPSAPKRGLEIGRAHV